MKREESKGRKGETGAKERKEKRQNEWRRKGR